MANEVDDRESNRDIGLYSSSYITTTYIFTLFASFKYYFETIIKHQSLSVIK